MMDTEHRPRPGTVLRPTGLSPKPPRTPDIPQEPNIDMERWEIISG